MADQLLRERRRQHQVPPYPRRHHRSGPDITAAAAIMMANPRVTVLRTQPWQDQAWYFYHCLGTFRFAMDWHSQTMSRVRLTAAAVAPGGNEPKVIETGPAADIMRAFFNGTSGQSRYMSRMDVLTQVAGEGYVVAYDEPSATPGAPPTRCWQVVSASQLKVQQGTWQLEKDLGSWVPLPEETTLVFRQWIEDAEYNYLPDSPARSALGTMQTIDLLQKRIVAQAVSRLAGNGILLYPAEATFPVNPKFKDEPNPFAAELFDIAGKSIQDPGSATSALPLPIEMPSELIDKWRHLSFANTFDEHMLEYLQFEYDRLATAMNMPKEVISGMGSTSHWNAWTLDEQGIEIHVKPPVEVLCAGLTHAYLGPALEAAGEATVTADGSQIIVWYDTSQLDVPPDRSAAADAAFDRNQISGSTYRREKGFSDDDKPSNDDLKMQLLLEWAKLDAANAVPTVIKELTGDTVPVPPAPPAAGAAPAGPGGGGPPAASPAPAAGPPVPPQDNTAPPSD